MSRILVFIDMQQKPVPLTNCILCIMKMWFFSMVVLSSPIIFVKNNFVLILLVCFSSMTHFVLLPVVYTHFYGILIYGEGSLPLPKYPSDWKGWGWTIEPNCDFLWKCNADLTSLSIWVPHNWGIVQGESWLHIDASGGHFRGHVESDSQQL